MNELVSRHGANACVGCGRCTYACVAAQRYEGFSPRKVVEDALDGRRPDERGIWACTACGACADVCNADVDFPQMVRELRTRQGAPLLAHHGMLNRVAKLTSNGRPRPPSWITPDLLLDQSSEILLFVGCTPYFDVVFRDFRDDLLELPRAAVRLLNAMGVRPRVMMSERCCGHDAYWSGDQELFQRLAQANVREVAGQGIKEVVAFCPECASAWRDLYPAVTGSRELKVLSLAEFLAEGLEGGRLDIMKGKGRATFQDPCRLAKVAGIVKPPRSVLERTGEVVEMPRHGAQGGCCGPAGWAYCDHTAKKVQIDRLKEAVGTGADTLVTACPKCLVHLSCAERHHRADVGGEVRIEDLYVRAARGLKHRASGQAIDDGP